MSNPRSREIRFTSFTLGGCFILAAKGTGKTSVRLDATKVGGLILIEDEQIMKSLVPREDSELATREQRKAWRDELGEEPARVALRIAEAGGVVLWSISNFQYYMKVHPEIIMSEMYIASSANSYGRKSIGTMARLEKHARDRAAAAHLIDTLPIKVLGGKELPDILKSELVSTGTDVFSHPGSATHDVVLSLNECETHSGEGDEDERDLSEGDDDEGREGDGDEGSKDAETSSDAEEEVSDAPRGEIQGGTCTLMGSSSEIPTLSGAYVSRRGRTREKKIGGRCKRGRSDRPRSRGGISKGRSRKGKKGLGSSQSRKFLPPPRAAEPIIPEATYSPFSSFTFTLDEVDWGGGNLMTDPAGTRKTAKNT